VQINIEIEKNDADTGEPASLLVRVLHAMDFIFFLLEHVIDERTAAECGFLPGLPPFWYDLKT
jgi:hypothetical protein